MPLTITTMFVSASALKMDSPSVQPRDHPVIAPILFLLIDWLSQIGPTHPELMAPVAQHALGREQLGKISPAKEMSVVEDQVHIRFTSRVKLMYSNSSYVELLQMK